MFLEFFFFFFLPTLEEHTDENTGADSHTLDGMSHGSKALHFGFSCVVY